MSLPEHHITSQSLAEKLQPITDLEPVPLKVQKMLLTPQGVMLLLDAMDTEYVYPLNQFEAAAVSFVASGCNKHSHVPMIYDHFLGTLRNLDVEVMRCVIESKHGDVAYARMVCQDRHHRLMTTPLSVADAVIISMHTGKPLLAVKAAIEQFTVFSEDWMHSDDIDEFWSSEDANGDSDEDGDYA